MTLVGSSFSSQETLQGLSELFKKLDSLPAKLEAKVLQSGLKKGAKHVLDAAKGFCPVSDTQYRSLDQQRWGAHGPGSLKASLKISSRIDKKRGVVKVEVGTPLWYGRFVEYGTAKEAAQPFLRPALDTTDQQVITSLQEEMISKLDKL